MRYLGRVSRSPDPIGLTRAEGYVNYFYLPFRMGGDPQKRKGLSLLRPALTVVSFPYSQSAQAHTLQPSLLAMIFQVSYWPSSPSFPTCSPTCPSTTTPYSYFTTASHFHANILTCQNDPLILSPCPAHLILLKCLLPSPSAQSPFKTKLKPQLFCEAFSDHAAICPFCLL